MVDVMASEGRARLSIERWPVPCAFCGCRFGWVLTVEDWPVQEGCVAAHPVASMIRMARRELSRRSV
jgi:hypothetical protein